MNAKLTMVYWKSKKFWLGKLVEHPEIMTQGRTLTELEENIKDAYRMMVLGFGTISSCGADAGARADALS